MGAIMLRTLCSEEESELKTQSSQQRKEEEEDGKEVVIVVIKKFVVQKSESHRVKKPCRWTFLSKLGISIARIQPEKLFCIGHFAKSKEHVHDWASPEDWAAGGEAVSFAAESLLSSSSALRAASALERY